jgi:hypothetical protein
VDDRLDIRWPRVKRDVSLHCRLIRNDCRIASRCVTSLRLPTRKPNPLQDRTQDPLARFLGRFVRLFRLMLILLFFGPFEDLGGMVSEFFFEVGEDAIIGVWVEEEESDGLRDIDRGVCDRNDH